MVIALLEKGAAVDIQDEVREAQRCVKGVSPYVTALVFLLRV